MNLVSAHFCAQIMSVRLGSEVVIVFIVMNDLFLFLAILQCYIPLSHFLFCVPFGACAGLLIDG
jgi:hypothetical protein